MRSYFQSVFSCIHPQYRKMRIRNNSVFGQFSRSVAKVNIAELRACTDLIRMEMLGNIQLCFFKKDEELIFFSHRIYTKYSVRSNSTPDFSPSAMLIRLSRKIVFMLSVFIYYLTGSCIYGNTQIINAYLLFTKLQYLLPPVRVVL